MKTAQLLSVFAQLSWGDSSDAEVVDVTQDSRQVKPGSVFVAIRGTSVDGHLHLKQAQEKGAVALVVEDTKEVPADFKGAVVKVKDTRQALDQLAQKFFSNPCEKLFCIGITGTNGKTTVSYMIEKILTHFGWPTGVIGTIDHHLGTRVWPSQLTTPDAVTLQRRLKEFVDHGAQAVAFEVSSHALSQKRADAIPFSVAAFTNFTRDHLDYHGTMEEYFACKQRLFTELLGRGPVSMAVLNGDDPWIRKLNVLDGTQVWWLGQSEADFMFRIMKADLSGTLFQLTTPRGSSEIHLPCPGLHNVYNAVTALACALAAGVGLERASEALSEFYGAPGRLEKIANAKNLNVFVDYAHTDDALRSVLSSLAFLKKESHSQARIITVFGCGGDRDKGKRPLMAKAACEGSDVVVFTSDNPRSEDPEEILSDIMRGIPPNWPGESVREADRRQAIGRALQMAKEGDVILIAGKGHEDYQIMGTKKLEFSDQKVVKEFV